MNLHSILIGTIIAGLSGALLAQENTGGKFYRGAMDDQVVAAPNGAMVNREFRDWVMDGGGNGPKLIEVLDGVHLLAGYSLSNYVFIEGRTGLIAFETGNNMGMGRGALEHIREVTDLPVKNIIYSHHHYMGGAKAYVEDARARGVEHVEIYGHPDVNRNARSTTLTLGPMQFRRANIQLGFYLLTHLRFARYQARQEDEPVGPVSVVICARNEMHNLERFLPLILEQDYPEYEVVVVNDASLDESEMLLSNLSARYSHLRYTSIPANEKFTHGKKLAD